MELVSAIDVRVGILATVMSKARRAAPWYTAANPMSAQAKMATWNGPAPAKPVGHTTGHSSSGQNASSSTVSWLCVARMPSVSHVSTICSPGVSRGRNPCTIWGLSGSELSMAWKPPYVQTGVRLPKILWPLSFQPPSTRSAVVVDSSRGMSLPGSPWMAAKISPSAAFSRMKRHESSPIFSRSAATPVQ